MHVACHMNVLHSVPTSNPTKAKIEEVHNRSCIHKPCNHLVARNYITNKNT